MASTPVALDPATGQLSADWAAVQQKTGIPKVSGGATQYGTPGNGLLGLVASALTVNEDRYVPSIVAHYPVTITGWMFEVSTGPASNANVRVGIYRADTDQQPTGAPLYDSGNVAVASAFTGVKTVSALSVALTPGVYLQTLNCDVALTLRGVFIPSTGVLPTLGATGVISRFGVGRTYAAFPTPGTKWTAATAGSGGGMISQVFWQWTE